MRAINKRNTIKMKSILIAAPVYNESSVIIEFLNELNTVLATLLDSYKFEFLLVNDGSIDNTIDMLKTYNNTIPLRVVSLARNFGHQAACQACLDEMANCEHDAMIIMDSDMQDDPGYIVEFIDNWEKGHLVCYAIRKSRQESVLYRFMFKSFYRILNFCARIKIPVDSGIYSLMDKKVVNYMLKSNLKNWYLPGVRAYVGFSQIGISVPRRIRHDNISKVGIMGLFRLAFSAIYSFSYVPIRIFNFLGLLSILVSALLLAYILFSFFITGITIPAWSSIMTTIIFFGGINMFGLGMMGEYLAIIHSRQQNLPNYIISDELIISQEQKRGNDE